MNPPVRFNYPLAPQLLLPADFKNDWIQCPFTGEVGRSSQLDRMPPPGQSLQFGRAHIPESAADAVLNTTGFDPGLRSRKAKVAFPRFLRDFIEMHGSIGAAVGALAAADTGPFINHHPAILSFGNGLHRAKLGAHRLLALKAHDGQEIEVQLISHFSGPNGLDPAPPGFCFKGKAILLATGDFARIAADTGVHIDEQNFVHHGLTPFSPGRVDSAVGRCRSPEHTFRYP